MNLKLYRLDQQPGDPGKTFSLSPKAVGWQDSFLVGEGSLCSIKDFNWLGEAHHHYGDNLLYSKSTDFNVNFIQHSEVSRISLTKYLGTVAQSS